MPATFDLLPPDDLKALLCERYGSVTGFTIAHKLYPTAVADLLRGKGSQRVLSAVEFAVREARYRQARITELSTIEAMAERSRHAVADRETIIGLEPSRAAFQNHRLNAAAK